MSALEAELGPFHSIPSPWMERADAKISKQRRTGPKAPPVVRSCRRTGNPA